MKFNIALFVLFTGAFCFDTIAGEPAWWTKQKQSCGLPSGTAYNTWVSQGSPCKSASGSSSSSHSTGAELGKAIGTAIVEGFQQADEESKRRASARAAEEAEQARLNAIEDESKKERLLGEMMDVEPSSTLSMDQSDKNGELGLMMGDDQVSSSSASASALGSLPASKDPDPLRDDPAWNKGNEDGVKCFSESAGNHCYGAEGEILKRCQNNYRAGYKNGENDKRISLDHARKAGIQDKKNKKKNSSFTHPKAQGPCRIQWIESYNEGYAGAPASPVGR